MLWHIGDDGDHRRVDCRAQAGISALIRRDNRSMALLSRAMRSIGTALSFKSGPPVLHETVHGGSRKTLSQSPNGWLAVISIDRLS
jgi:hypothetical protein